MGQQSDGECDRSKVGELAKGLAGSSKVRTSVFILGLVEAI